MYEARCCGAGTVVPSVSKATDAFFLSHPSYHGASILDVTLVVGAPIMLTF